MHLKSDKQGRLYMRIDSKLLAAMEVAAKKDGLSLEDEIEQILCRRAGLRPIVKICSRLSVGQRLLVLDYAKGLLDENEQAHSTDSPQERTEERHGMRKMRLKEIRERAGLSQESVAAMVGVQQNTVSQWESGKRNPTAPMLIRLAEALHCTIDEIYGRNTGQSGA